MSLNKDTYVADTMALILRLEKRKMPEKVRNRFKLAEDQQSVILIPAMVFAELAYLSEKRRIETTLSNARTYLEANSTIKEYPLAMSTIQAAFEIDDIPELHDRLIAAAAKEKRIPILTNDPDINESLHVEAIWQVKY